MIFEQINKDASVSERKTAAFQRKAAKILLNPRWTRARQRRTTKETVRKKVDAYF
jgi:hypothetical protein